jgi:hypothetical protein
MLGEHAAGTGAIATGLQQRQDERRDGFRGLSSTLG